MPEFLLEARFCKRNGKPGRWSGQLAAADIGAAIALVRRELDRRYREPGKVDIYAVAIDPPPAPAADAT